MNVKQTFPLSMILLVFAIMLPTASAQSTDGWQPAFNDSFDRADLGMDWVVLRGDWRPEGKQLHITRTWTSDSAIRTEARFTANVRLEFDVKSKFTVAAGVRMGEQFWDGGGQQPAERLLRLRLDPVGATNTADGLPLLEPDRFHHVVIEYQDGKLRCWVDDKLVRDEEVTYTGRFNDHVALWSIKDSIFDNVVVLTKPYGPAFKPQPRSMAEENGRATIDAGEFIRDGEFAAELQGAIDSLPATGGSVLLPAGEIVLRQMLRLREGVSLRGEGDRTRLMLPGPMIWSKAAANADKADTIVTVQDASRFRVGDQLCIGAHAMFYLYRGEPHIITRIDGNTLHLNQPLGTGVAADNTPIGVFFPLIYARDASDIDVRDLTLVGHADDPAPFNGDYGASALTFFFVRDVRVSGITVDGWKGDAISYQGGRDSLFTNCRVLRATHFGYHPGSCQQRVIMSRLIAEQCKQIGFFFCRYNQQSVVSRSTFSRNGDAMIGGLASAGDAFNAITFNYGEQNAHGIPFIGGANDVFVGNVVVDSGKDQIIDITGGTYDSTRPSGAYFYAGPSRYHVIAGNTFIDTRDQPIAVLTEREGASSNLFADNRYSLKAVGEGPFTKSGPTSVSQNERLENNWNKPDPGIAPPPPPPVVVRAIDHYVPDRQDCGFQLAIDAAAKVGGTVLLPAGRYRINATLAVPSNVTLLGEGIATVLLYQGDGPAISLVDTDSASVRWITLRGTGTGTGIDMRRATGAVIEAAIAEDFATGIKAADCTRLLLSQSKVRRCDVGIHATDGADVSIVECHVLESARCGIELLHVGERTLIDSSIIWRARVQTLRIAGQPTAQLRITGNVISNAGHEAMILEDVHSGHIQGNVIHNPSLTGRGTHPAVRLATGTRNTRIIHNRIADDLLDPAMRTAVHEDSGATDNVIAFNVCNPNNWPRSGSLDRLIVIAEGSGTKALNNVVQPYPTAKAD